MNSIAYIRVVVVALLAYLLIVTELFLLTSFRLLYLPHSLAVLCNDDMSTYEVCANELMKIMLFGAQWNAVKFTIYVITLSLLFLVSLRRCHSMIAIHQLLVCVIVLFITLASLSPAWVECMATITAALLSGAFITKRFKVKQPQ